MIPNEKVNSSQVNLIPLITMTTPLPPPCRHLPSTHLLDLTILSSPGNLLLIPMESVMAFGTFEQRTASSKLQSDTLVVSCIIFG